MQRLMEVTPGHLIRFCRIHDSHDPDAPPSKRTRKFRCRCFQQENSKRIKRIRKKLLNEFSENELSKGNIEGDKIHKAHPRSIKKSPKNEHIPPSPKHSSDSVIYVGPVISKDFLNIPMVDLTNLSEDDGPRYTKSLKTIYFPSRNFNRSSSSQKSLVTTSMVNLPVTKKSTVFRRLFSASEADKRINTKLSILNLPECYQDTSDLNCVERDYLIKSVLTESDHNIIDWILNEEVNSLMELDSNEMSSLDAGVDTIQELCSLYDVSSNSSFD